VRPEDFWRLLFEKNVRTGEVMSLREQSKLQTDAGLRVTEAEVGRGMFVRGIVSDSSDNHSLAMFFFACAAVSCPSVVSVLPLIFNRRF